jgi:hypothetical protein
MARAKEQEGGVLLAQEPVKSAADLLSYLKETGTGESRTRPFDAWLKAHQGATGKELYDHLAAVKCPVGTLRKAGKWLYGDEFEPEQIVKQAPEEEILRLRAENENLRRQLSETSANHLGTLRALEHERTKVREYTNELSMYKMRHRPNDPKDIGAGNE